MTYFSPSKLENRADRRAAASSKPDSIERQAWRVREFCEAHRVSRSTFYKYLKLGKIRVIRIGGRVLVPAAEAARIASEGLQETGGAA
jgi:excisionase family DNA binding protein